jgi:hypothetical protein
MKGDDEKVASWAQRAATDFDEKFVVCQRSVCGKWLLTCEALSDYCAARGQRHICPLLKPCHVGGLFSLSISIVG